MSLNRPGDDDAVFGPFRLDRRRRTLHRQQTLVLLGTRAFDVLCVLVAARGSLVTKDELLSQVWPGLIVEENNIQVQVWALRKALGKTADGREYIATVPGRGYRFAGEILTHSPILVPGAPTGRRPSIAVLAFTDMSEQASYEHWADGLVEDITTELARLRWLLVIARNSSFAYKGRSVDIRQVGYELDARYVVEGSVRASGGRVRISVQLIEAETRAHLWAETLDRPVGELFSTQDALTRRIVAAVELHVRAAEMANAKGENGGATAYSLYMRALSDIYTQHPPNLTRAETLLRRAIEIDQDHADAHAAYAYCVVLRAVEGPVSAERMAETRNNAIALANRAVSIDPENSRALTTAGFALGTLHRRFDEAIEMTHRAVSLNPGAAYAHNAHGQVLAVMGKTSEALACFEEVGRLVPFQSPLMHNGLLVGVTMGHLFGGRFEDAIKWGRRASHDEPERSSPRRFVAAALAHLGRRDEAHAEINEILRLQPVSSLARSSMVSFTQTPLSIYLDGLRLAGLPER